MFTSNIHIWWNVNSKNKNKITTTRQTAKSNLNEEKFLLLLLFLLREASHQTNTIIKIGSHSHTHICESQMCVPVQYICVSSLDYKLLWNENEAINLLSFYSFSRFYVFSLVCCYFVCVCGFLYVRTNCDCQTLLPGDVVFVELCNC